MRGLDFFADPARQARARRLVVGRGAGLGPSRLPDDGRRGASRGGSRAWTAPSTSGWPDARRIAAYPARRPGPGLSGERATRPRGGGDPGPQPGPWSRPRGVRPGGRAARGRAQRAPPPCSAEATRCAQARRGATAGTRRRSREAPARCAEVAPAGRGGDDPALESPPAARRRDRPQGRARCTHRTALGPPAAPRSRALAGVLRARGRFGPAVGCRPRPSARRAWAHHRRHRLAKGGVGKTSFAAGIAIVAGTVLDQIGHMACLVDANIANPDAWGQMNLLPGRRPCATPWRRCSATGTCPHPSTRRRPHSPAIRRFARRSSTRGRRSAAWPITSGAATPGRRRHVQPSARSHRRSGGGGGRLLAGGGRRPRPADHLRPRRFQRRPRLPGGGRSASDRGRVHRPRPAAAARQSDDARVRSRHPSAGDQPWSRSPTTPTRSGWPGWRGSRSSRSLSPLRLAYRELTETIAVMPRRPRADRVPPHRGGAGLIDRDPQLLPVPLGDLRPRRVRSRTARLRLWRRHSSRSSRPAGSSWRSRPRW